MNILQPHIKRLNPLLYQTQIRFFSISESNVFKSQHVRYIPKKRINFTYDSPDGPLTLVFQGDDSYTKRVDNWKISIAVAAPASALAYYTFGMAYWWAYPMLYIPVVYNIYDTIKLRVIAYKSEVYRMWLLKNGD